MDTIIENTPSATKHVMLFEAWNEVECRDINEDVMRTTDPEPASGAMKDEPHGISKKGATSAAIN